MEPKSTQKRDCEKNKRRSKVVYTLRSFCEFSLKTIKVSKPVFKSKKLAVSSHKARIDVVRRADIVILRVCFIQQIILSGIEKPENQGVVLFGSVLRLSASQPAVRLTYRKRTTLPCISDCVGFRNNQQQSQIGASSQLCCVMSHNCIICQPLLTLIHLFYLPPPALMMTRTISLLCRMLGRGEGGLRMKKFPWHVQIQIFFFALL